MPKAAPDRDLYVSPLYLAGSTFTGAPLPGRKSAEARRTSSGVGTGGVTGVMRAAPQGTYQPLHVVFPAWR